MTSAQADASTAKDPATPHGTAPAGAAPADSTVDGPNSSAPENPEDLHWLQRLMDNPWILLLLGILIPFLSYTTWGWIELLFIKPAQLP